jgi:hypothetical protein
VKLVDTISYDEVEFLYARNHYDLHIEGLCYYRGFVSEFKTHDWYNEDEEKPVMVNIYELTMGEKLKALWDKKLFEICVGYHWSYPERVVYNYHIRRPRWLYQFLFNWFYYGFDVTKWHYKKAGLSKWLHVLLRPTKGS